MKIVCCGWFVMALLLAGCGSPPKAGGTAANPAMQSSAPKPVADDQPIQPPDALWTIVCAQIRGANHVERAKITKQQLAASTKMKDFYVVHEEEQSTLYYGFYRFISPRERPDMTRDDVRDGERAQADMAKVRSLENNLGDKLFPMAVMSPLEPVDPPAPAEWDLRNVDRNKPDGDPSKAYWSLEIAVYKDNPQRKQMAVESVRSARESGVKDIYFYHGKTSSSVCIGTWPRAAVKEQDSDRVQSSNPDMPLLVLPQQLSGVHPTGPIKNREGQTVQAMAPRLEPTDPTMIDTMQKYPRRNVNGYEIKHTYTTTEGGTVDRYDPSLVIFIPRDDPSGMLGGGVRQIDNDEQDTRLMNTNRSNGGQLRSLDGSGGAR